jgi:teichuronic acid biosynthesis glycosyltransferase TuaC
MKMNSRFRVLMITSAFPSKERPHAVPFIVRQIDALRSAGIDVDVFTFRGKKRLTNYLIAWLRLRRHIAGKRYDVMHAQWGHSAVIAFPKRLPWVITFRGNDLEGIVGKSGRYTLKGRILQAVSKLAARHADGAIAVSKALADRLGRDNVEIIPSGLDLDLFKPMDKSECRERLGLDPNRKLILFAASSPANPRKRYELANAAVSALKIRMDIELIVATGARHSEIPIYMNACDALLLTSLHEGSPNVVKEAIACDLPVVAVDVGDVRERIEKAGAGAVCGDSPEELAAGIEKVINSEPVSTRTSIVDLDERETTRRVIGIYRKAIAKRKASLGAARIGGEDRFSINRV